MAQINNKSKAYFYANSYVQRLRRAKAVGDKPRLTPAIKMAGLAAGGLMSSCGKFAVVRGAFGLSVERRREMRVEVKR
jgi:hypothetical protein